MNIHELDSYNLGDAVKFHRRLNPRIWGRDEHLLPEVREKLLAIAADFQEFLGVEDLDVQDITLSGSNAAYSYTKNSDIDLHLVVTMPDNPVYQELFNAKKYQYNDEHNIKIGGADVELYVQPADQAHHSQGIYSIKKSEWQQVPQRKRAQVDDACVRDKVADLDSRIHSAVKSKNAETMSTLWNKIKAMRKSGLEQHGEFGCENIAFKLLRNSGCIGLLKDAVMAAQDRELSLREAPKQRFRYGFSEGMQSQPYSTSDGVAASTKQFLEDRSDNNIVQDFIQHVTTELGIDPVPEIHLHTDSDWSEHNQSFGRYDPDAHALNVSMPNRHVMDVLRTVAHELVHCSQNQQHGQLPDDAGETGSRWENDANARAGIIMRDWANRHPEHFAHDALEEGASGYIPKNKKEAAMPQYAMALSVDIKPGQTGKEANKLALNTGRNGEPSLLMKTANLREYRMPQPSQGPGRYRDLNEPLGPETPPRMPSGTVKVDVSDTQDWYQLGQDISNLDIANKAHYNQGPPHTVLAFGSEDLEHMYIQQLKRLGLNTHDLDEPGEDDMDEGINEGNQLTLRDFVVTISPHALSQAHNKGVDVHMVDDILRNISKVKDNIMSLEPGRALILHNGQGTGLGVRRGQGNNLTLATVFPTNPGFRKGKHPTFQVEANEFIHRQLRENIEDFPIANVRRANGAIGNQGVNTEQAADVLTHAAGMQVSPDWSMRQLVDALKADPAAQQRLRQFVQQNPVTVYSLPDGTYHLQDGHHRTFLLNLLGDETVPAVVKEDATQAKTVEFEGLTLKVIKQGHELIVDALDDWGNKVLGHVKFNIGDGRELDPQDLRVDDKYQGQGIARVMYDYVKSLGYTIVRSYDQTDAGAGFWNKHRGEDVRVWEQGVAESENNDTAISLSKLGKFHPGADTLAEFVPERATAQYALHPDKWESTFYSLTNKDSDKLKYYGPKKISIPPGTLVGDMAIANKFYRAKTPEEQEQYAELYKASLQPYPVDVSEYRMPELLIPQQSMAENFHDGKNPGRKGLAKRSGVNTKASVSSLRKTAKNSSGEKQRMAHWLANMKAGRAKAKRK